MKSINLSQMREILLDNKPHDFGIILNGGIISRKTIKLLKNGKYRIYNHIDNYEQDLTSQELQENTHSNIALAASLDNLIRLD